MTREEAITILQDVQNPRIREAIFTLHPELRESEDERIRAVILKLVLGMRDEIFTTADKLVTKPKVLAWLEKQKEQNLIMANSPQLKEQKPAEWSEEDKAMIESLIRHTQEEFDELCNDRYGHQEIISDLKESCRERMRWLEKLKSLCPSWQNTYRQTVHTIFKMLKGKDFYSMPSSCVSLLNDIRVKCKDAIDCAPILDEPSWKPSKEQMDSLRDTIVQTKGYSYSVYLPELYEQLKKLM